MTIAILDVCYRGALGCAACVLVDSWAAQAPAALYVEIIEDVEPYEPGSFYRRELPCLVAVLRLLPAPPTVVVIDGYVWLPPMGRPGLGAHLYEALGRTTPVIGIAKSSFADAKSCAFVIPAYRGISKRPLYVTTRMADTSKLLVGSQTNISLQPTVKMKRLKPFGFPISASC